MTGESPELNLSLQFEFFELRSVTCISLNYGAIKMLNRFCVLKNCHYSGNFSKYDIKPIKIILF